MHPTDNASRRSVIRTFFASMAAAGAGLFGVAHAQPSSDATPQMTKANGLGSVLDELRQHAAPLHRDTSQPTH